MLPYGMLISQDSGAPTIVTVEIINDDGKTEVFQLHKNFACHYSAYFERAFNGPYAEGESQKARLEEVEHDVFAIFVFESIPRRSRMQKADGLAAGH